MKELHISAGQSTAVVQGYGNVGSVTCRELLQLGFRIIGIGDLSGSIYNEDGIDLTALDQFIADGNQLGDFPEAERIPDEDLLTLECTVLIPAAMERVIHADNADRLRCCALACTVALLSFLTPTAPVLPHQAQARPSRRPDRTPPSARRPATLFPRGRARTPRHPARR